MRPEIVLCIAFLSILIPPAIAVDSAVSLNNVIYFTEQYPPFNYQEEGRLQGISVDLLEQMLAYMNTTLNRSDIKLLPWDQGYEMALQDNNTVIFSAVRLPERETAFKWVGPISPIKTVLFAMKKRHIKINSSTDLIALKVGAVRDSAEGPLAVEAGANPDNLVVSNGTDELIDMLKAGTIDAWASSDLTGMLLAKEAGLDEKEYEIICNLTEETPLYYAFNRKTSDLTVHSFQEALNQTKTGKGADGTSDFEKILYRYLPVMYGRSNTTSQQIMDLLNGTSADIEMNASKSFINISTNAHPVKDNPEVAVFVIDTRGDVMAHSNRPELVGLNDMNRADSSGKRFIEAVIVGALTKGEGKEDFIYSTPAATGLYYKTAYYRLTRGSDGREYIVGCVDYKK
jgi:polar amino acid transport system substrate-binding protein